MVFGYFFWDLLHLRKKKKYSQENVLFSFTYYIIILPIISFSYNYRYFQWLLPFILLIFVKNMILESSEIFRKNKQNELRLGRNRRFFRNLLLLIFYCLVTSFLISIIYFIQNNNNNLGFEPQRVFLGVFVYNNYLISFFYCYLGYFLMGIILFWMNKRCFKIFLISLLYGISGLAFYYMLRLEVFYIYFEVLENVQLMSLFVRYLSLSIILLFFTFTLIIVFFYQEVKKIIKNSF